MGIPPIGSGMSSFKVLNVISRILLIGKMVGLKKLIIEAIIIFKEFI